MINYIYENQIVVSILILIVLLIRQPVARKLGAKWAYALWALPFLRLIIPPVYSLDKEFEPIIVYSYIQDINNQINLQTIPVLNNTTTITWEIILISLWIVIAIGLFIFAFNKHTKYQNQLKASAIEPNNSQKEFIHNELKRSSVKYSNTIITPLVQTPAVTGLLRSSLLLPINFFDDYSLSEQQYMLAHESIHIKRNDLWVRSVLLATRYLFWFNPIIHIASYYVIRDQELSCDQQLFAEKNNKEKSAFAELLVKTAEHYYKQPNLYLQTSFISSLEERIIMMHKHNTQKHWLPGLLILSTITLTGFSSITETEDNHNNTAVLFKISIQNLSNEVLNDSRAITTFNKGATIELEVLDTVTEKNEENGNSTNFSIDAYPKITENNNLKSYITIKQSSPEEIFGYIINGEDSVVINTNNYTISIQVTLIQTEDVYSDLVNWSKKSLYELAPKGLEIINVNASETYIKILFTAENFTQISEFMKNINDNKGVDPKLETIFTNQDLASNKAPVEGEIRIVKDEL